MQSHSVGLFTHFNGTYTADASDLGIGVGVVPDELGITHRSGVVSKFTHTHNEYAHGDLLSFHYFSSLNGYKLVLLND